MKVSSRLFFLLLIVVLTMSSTELLAQQGKRIDAEAAKARWKQSIEAKKAQRQDKWKEKTVGNKERAAAKREEARQRWLEKKQQGQQTRAEKRAEWQKKWGAANAEKLQNWKERWQQLRQQNPNLSVLQEKIQALKEARQSGQHGAWQERMQQLRQHFQSMDAKTRSGIYQNMPEFSHKLDQLYQNPQMWNSAFSATGPKGGQHNYQGQIQHQGNTWSHQGQYTGPQGNSVDVQGQHVRNGNQVDSQTKWTTESGQQFENSVEWIFDVLED